MKITAFDGSMRGTRSITNLMVEDFLEGARGAGAETEHVFLVRKKIHRCNGCLSCWIRTPGRCVQKDDMAEMIEKYMASDVVVMATPVYVENVTGLMKDFMDRLIPITDPHFEPDENGETRHAKRYERYPGIVAISNAGFPEGSAFEVFRILFRRIARSLNARLLAEIYRPGGGLLGLGDPALAPLVDGYRKALQAAGAEIAREGRISEETSSRLEETMVPTEAYNVQVNLLWDRLLARRARTGETDL